jgi:hypothetical protein
LRLIFPLLRFWSVNYRNPEKNEVVFLPPNIARETLGCTAEMPVEAWLNDARMLLALTRKYNFDSAEHGCGPHPGTEPAAQPFARLTKNPYWPGVER